MRGVCHSRQTVESVITAYREGHKRSTIAKMTGVCQSAVYRILKGEHPHNRTLVVGDGNVIPKEKVEEVMRLYVDNYAENLGARKISERTGVSEPVVVRILRGQHRHNKVRLMNGKRPANRIRSNTRKFEENTQA